MLYMLLNPQNSDRGLKNGAKVYISRLCRSASIVPTKTKLLSFTHLDYVVNWPKRNLDRFRSSRFTSVVFGLAAVHWLVVLNCNTPRAAVMVTKCAQMELFLNCAQHLLPSDNVEC